MHKLISLTLSLLTSLCLFSCSTTKPVSPAPTTAPTLTIVHTNDTHSQIDPAVSRKGGMQGGVTERAAMLEYLRAKEDADLLYFDAGDMVQGSPYFNIFKGELEVLCMNQQHLLATTFGNHEFDNGLEGIHEMLSKAEFPLICCNYHCEGTLVENLVLPSMTLSCHGVKVGITGVSVAPEGLIFARNWAGIRYEDPIGAANREAEALRRQGCDLVIVLSHLGYEAAPKPDHKNALDSDLAKASRDIDLIIGGHSHTNIERGVQFTNQKGLPVFVTQTGGKGAPMGYLKIAMKPGSEYKECRYSVDSIVCHKLHPEDYDLNGYGSAMDEFIAPYRDQLKEQMNVSLGHAPKTLSRYGVQTLLGNFTTDAYRIIGEKFSGRKIDVSIMNKGGLRSDLNAGDVTIGTIYEIFPFENTIVVLDLKGSELKQLIESNAGRKLDCWSGAQITLEMDGDQCVASQILIGGEPIDADRTYTVCTIDYLAEGNGGMTALTYGTNILKTGVLIRDAMIDYVKERSARGIDVSAKIDDRVIDHTQANKDNL